MAAKKRAKIDIYLFGKSGKPVQTWKSARTFILGVKSLDFYFKGTFSARQTDISKQEKLDYYLYELLERLTLSKKLTPPKPIEPPERKVKLKLKRYDRDTPIYSHKDKKFYYFRFLEGSFTRPLKINENRYKEQIKYLFDVFYPSIRKFWKDHSRKSLNAYIFRLMIGIKYKDSKELEKQGWGADRAWYITSESDLKKFLLGNLRFILNSKSGKRGKRFLEYVYSPSIEYAAFRGFSLEVILREGAK